MPEQFSNDRRYEEEEEEKEVDLREPGNFAVQESGNWWVVDTTKDLKIVSLNTWRMEKPLAMSMHNARVIQKLHPYYRVVHVSRILYDRGFMIGQTIKVT